MNNWKFYFLTCSLIFIAGITVGQIRSFSGDSLEKISKVVSVISSLVAIFGVVVAYLTFFSWKAQYKNAKLDVLIDSLEDTFDSLNQTIQRYCHDTLMVAKYRANAGVSESYEALHDKEIRSKLDYFDKRSAYFVAYHKLQRHLDCTHIITITPDFIVCQATIVFQKSCSVYTTADFGESDKKLDENQALLEELWQTGAMGFRELRAKALLTTRSTADK